MHLETIPIFRSARRKTLALQIGRDGQLRVRAPQRLPESVILHFLEQQKDWIKQHQQQRERLHQPSRTYTTGETFLFLGNHIQLDLVHQGTRSLWLDHEGFKLVLRNRHRAKMLFEAWYKKEARRVIHERVRLYATLMDVTPGPIRISNAKHTWGSCAHDNRLNFTWRLVMAPIEVIDYVVIHELSHITHKNHGSRFWQRVDSFCGDHKTHRAWLDVHRHLLDV